MDNNENIVQCGKLTGQLSPKGNLVGSIGKGILKVTVNDHSVLTNRDLPDQHPIEAITGLNDELLSIKGNVSANSLSIKRLETRIDNKIRTVSEVPNDMQKGDYIFLIKEE